jgi:orotate phosphoribosyltransferase-like protein
MLTGVLMDPELQVYMTAHHQLHEAQNGSIDALTVEVRELRADVVRHKLGNGRRREVAIYSLGASGSTTVVAAVGLAIAKATGAL